MDITKSQSDFEAWWNAPEQAELRNSCAMGWGFRIWKAARESIEVELPERAKLERSGKNKGRYVCWPCSFDPEYALGINHTIDWFTEALRTAGIRIKGESEKC
ncbi:hypothetical protein [Yersinia enterocolitica]|uniref:Uncharacterized protein n=2 Tax=Yersinia enterocolitica TaxID=630 RepID=A0AAD2V4A9_YEREN|nr:hypothetical protein [Yersinia enterocolitica]EKN6066486.1 hypothetical protein [Yersinia enterocolitica]ELI8104672.1 hypothetical protein [Yersinia enterocolitica]CQR20391.1 Uncharacterised protein [Yersinia enterocolitica]CRX56203.1 Uncharacterised protein [Yersinia enterocolitica]HDZ9657767.1 hypothetical protein [Yersinia enterocolitica]